MNDKAKKLAEQIRDAIDDIWMEYYEEEGIESGDITPFESVKYNEYTNLIAVLIYLVGEANKGGNE